MKIIRAEYLGMCFGVRDAIALAEKTAGREPLTILGDLVHNETVLTGLRNRGVQFEQQPAKVLTNTVMVTAHGASERMLTETRQLGLNVLEATCPLVRVAHRSLAKLVVEGYHPVIIGQRGHVEVRGLTGDLSEFDVVLSSVDVEKLCERKRFGVVAQTTQPIDKVHELVRAIREQFPHSEVRFIDTVCQPTKQRQGAAVELARQCDLVIVIGGAHSNNTRELVKTCSLHCRSVRHIQTAEDLRREWFVGMENVGITAGTSTPDAVIEEVESVLRAIVTPSKSLQPSAVKQNKGKSCKHERIDMNYVKWIEHFKRNKNNRPEPDWKAPVNVPHQVMVPMLKSIEQFRLGDGGGPASLIAFNRESFRGRTEELRQIVDMWFAEEAEHARLLGCAVRRFGGRIITSHWSFTAFCLVRRVFGVQFELQVLTLTELVSTAYYRMLRSHSPDGPLAAMCELILRDEAGHVAFHRDRLMNAGRPQTGLAGWFWRVQFLAFGYGAGTVLWISHARCLKAIGGTRNEFYSEITRQITRFIRSLHKQPQYSRIAAKWAQPATLRVQFSK